MRKIYLAIIVLAFYGSIRAQHNAGHNGRILMIASNPAVSQQTGWPVGTWYAEVAHPYWAFTEAGYSVDVASPEGGEVVFDSFSDPEDPSQYAAFDYVSLGFKKDAKSMSIMKNTLKLSTVNPADYKAIFVCGGQGPMYTFIDNEPLHKFFVDFYLTGKPAAAICHGTCILLKAKLPNGKYLTEGKRWTGFASAEEQYADNYVGKKIQPFRIEDIARQMPNSNFVVGAPFSAFAVQDGNLITGQQQNSGTAAAELVIRELERQRINYPTYVLVHGAWSDESAWGYVRAQLAQRANVVVVNLPAHGIDQTAVSAVGLQDYVKSVKQAIMDQPGKVTLVGHSMAGIVISQVAEEIPDKVDKLVYVAAYLPKNGEDLLSLSKQDAKSKVAGALEFTADYRAASIRKDMIVPAVCADCSDSMKEILVKYHQAEPATPLSEKVTLTRAKFGSLPKYFIHTSEDYAVSYELQQAMVRNNGSIRQTFVMSTSHLPFVVQPAEFVRILSAIK